MQPLEHIIDGSVKCSYWYPTDEPKEIDPIHSKWVEVHCNVSKYSLKITKCDYFSSCG